MLIVACVEWGNYLGRGVEYVERLLGSVDRNLRQPFEFHVLTDEILRHERIRQVAGVELRPLTYGRGGWWNKVELFSPGMFPLGERVLYIDLDSVITGNLDELAAHKGIIHLRDWGWTKNVYGSGVMVWDAGEHAEIWRRWTPAIVQEFRGDQDWIYELGGWPALPRPPFLTSYRYHCKAGIPADCRIVSFHGKPKPHELAVDHELARAWRGA